LLYRWIDRYHIIPDLSYHIISLRKEIGAQSKTNAVFMNHSPGALTDLTEAVQKGFLTSLPAAPGFAPGPQGMQR